MLQQQQTHNSKSLQPALANMKIEEQILACTNSQNYFTQLMLYTMITQYEIPSLLRQEMPTMTTHIRPCRASLEIYASINDFTDYTKHAVEEHDFSLATKCFALAEKLYRNGDRIVKLLIENSFIYSITSFMPADHMERLRIRAIIPDKLYSLYLKQVTQSGC